MALWVSLIPPHGGIYESIPVDSEATMKRMVAEHAATHFLGDPIESVWSEINGKSPPGEAFAVQRDEVVTEFYLDSTDGWWREPIAEVINTDAKAKT